VLRLFILLIFSHLAAEVFPVSEIMINGEDESRINIVFLGDGYTDDQMEDYIDDVEDVVGDLFNEPPYSNYINFFNVYAVEVPSNESGTDHPATASDCGGYSNDSFYADTYFDSSFDLYGIHRLLYVQDNSAVYDALSDNTPQWDIIFVMVNTTMYGGAGGSFAVFSRHYDSNEIAIHEIGHSFAGLSDEYWAGFQYAWENSNMTENPDEATLTWSSWLYDNGVGIYPYEYPGDEWYRPHQNCKMRYLGPAFCSVCKEQTVRRIHSITTPVLGYYPESPLLMMSAWETEFLSVDIIINNPNTIEIDWFFDGSQLISSNTNSIEFDASGYPDGNHEIKAVVTDVSTLVRSDPSNLLGSEIAWNVIIEPGVYGDINHDGEVNVVDVVLSVQFILDADYSAEADLNSDGVLDILDVIALINLILSAS
jgi:hypothetical protein